MSGAEVEDARGRLLALRPLTMLDRLRLFKALGPELSMNEAYLGVASLAASVSAIDGVPLPFPASEAAVENAVERLGEAGIEAAAAALQPEDAGTVRALAGN
ncbi:MAG TPA: hypothetical protein PLX84_11670 [Acidiphilium sp.]|nr:hypothetical protein [Acidiphilium sp.]